jgi:peptidoglycan/xylan/chitin deacetylase (PgdA/CDA1 family)
MRLVSPLLKRAVYPTLHHAGWFGRMMPPGGYAVVNYHGVLPSDYNSREPFLDGNLVQTKMLREQVRFLKSHYRVMAPEEFLMCVEQGRSLPPRSILITCDDGLLNTLTDMLPILQEEGVPCLFFVTAASCGTEPGMLWYEELYLLMRKCPPSGKVVQLLSGDEAMGGRTHSFQGTWWSLVRKASQMDAETRAAWMTRVRDECGQISLRNERWRLLNAAELRKLAEAGMGIGAHTRTHPVLSLSTEEEARREIQSCKVELERALGRTVWAFAYPFGNPATMGEREFHMALDAGYTCAFLNVEHWQGQESNLFALPRTHVTADMTLPEFAAHLSGVHARLQRAVGR